MHCPAFASRISKTRAAVTIGRNFEVCQTIGSLKLELSGVRTIRDSEGAAGVGATRRRIAHVYAGREINIREIDGLGRLALSIR